MRERLVLGTLTLAAVLAVASCDDEVGLTSVPNEVETFTAALNGAKERPTPVTTPATGTATLSLIGGVLVYRIDVANITNVTAAHIHAPADTGNAAGVVVNLCGTGAPAPPCASGTVTGVLAAGVATQVGSGVGMSFDRLVNVLRTDSAYVNVHTSVTGCTPGTPGCNAGGEIRGQITQ